MPAPRADSSHGGVLMGVPHLLVVLVAAGLLGGAGVPPGRKPEGGEKAEPASAPRRYVNRVSRLGAASLRDVPDPQQRGLPPLPCGEASPAYAARFHDLMRRHGPGSPGPKKPEPKKEDKDAPKKPPSGAVPA